MRKEGLSRERQGEKELSHGDWGGNCGASVQDISPVAWRVENKVKEACPPLDAFLSECPRTDHSDVTWDGYGEWGRRRLKYEKRHVNHFDSRRSRHAGGSADDLWSQADRRSSLAPSRRARYKNSYFYKRNWTHGK